MRRRAHDRRRRMPGQVPGSIRGLLLPIGLTPEAQQPQLRDYQVAPVELERLVSDRVKVPQQPLIGPPLPEIRGYSAFRALFTVSVSLFAIGSVGDQSSIPIW